MSRIRHDERGQSLVLAVVFLTALLGMSAMVLDVGAWFRAQRAAQAAADAAALAGAQALPDNPATAESYALAYADKNGKGLAPSDIAFSDGEVPSDTISVNVRRDVSGFFSQFTSVNVSAHAAARGFKPGAAKWVAPIVVNIKHPDLSGTIAGTKCPCLGPSYATTLPLDQTGAPGAFDMLNLDPSSDTGTIGTSTLATWIDKGFDAYLPLGGYYSDPGAKFNSSQIQAALTDRMQTELLFPVYDTLTGTGSNATYHIIAWAAFHLTSFSANGNAGSISGWFTKTIWDGIESTTGTNAPDFGVRSVALIQ